MWLVVSLSVFLSFYAHASFQVKTQIHDIDHGSSIGETLFFLTSGHVVKFPTHEPKLISEMDRAHQARQWLQFTLNEKHEIEAYAVIASPLPVEKVYVYQQAQEETYSPTVIENLDLAKTYFHQSRYVDKESQCFNRAHIWTYEWFIKNSINSNKTWLFFTRKYIRKFKFEWWFHVSPSVRVLENGIAREKIMDVKYGRGPLDIKRWTDIFMRDDANCPLVKTYSDYANFPESGSCYTMRTSMFYYQPADIESKETWGTVRANWYDSEVKQAYLEAFDEIL